ncbi:hypothetical protein Ami103574_01510 [Aminipila butyrica]|uniref:Uncharacterized protein n=1 Tax=Aminipila butyrica TaxID=433296 RepID=A0A858BSH9_9FIRM|nr:hypothetical protein [Aminipila butyrica]QIB68065.1 hypothetical protein Ami103574_01510 [Aminipila butyrica]
MKKIWLIITIIIAFAAITTGTGFSQTSADIKVSVDGTFINFTNDDFPIDM